MSGLEIVLAAATGAGFPALGLYVARRDSKRREQLIARRPIANRYAQNERVWR